MTDADEKLGQAITAATEGRSREAHDLLVEVVRENEDDKDAWLWLARVVSTNRERETCLEKILELNFEDQGSEEEDVRDATRMQASDAPIGNWGAFLNSRPIGLQAEWQRPTKDNSGGFERRGILSRRYSFRRKEQSGIVLSGEEYKELLKKQESRPVGVMSHRGQSWWLFKGDIYRGSKDYTRSAVKTLVENPLIRVESVETAQFQRSSALMTMLSNAPVSLVTLLEEANAYLARMDSLCRLRDEIADRSDRLSRQASRLAELGRWIAETSPKTSIDDKTFKRQMRDLGFAPRDILEADVSASDISAQENLLRWWFSRMRLVITMLQALSSPLERVREGLDSCSQEGLAIFEKILAEARTIPDSSVERDIFDALIDSLGPGVARLQSFAQTEWIPPIRRRIEEAGESLNEVMPLVRAAMFESGEARSVHDGGSSSTLEPMDTQYPISYASRYVLPRVEGEYLEADDGLFIRRGDRRIFQSSGRHGISLGLGEHRKLVEGNTPFQVMQSGETTWWCCGRRQFYREKLGLTTATATALFHNKLDMDTVASSGFRKILSLIAVVLGVDAGLGRLLEESSIQAGRLDTLCLRLERLVEVGRKVVGQTEALISLLEWIEETRDAGRPLDQAAIRNHMRELRFAPEDVQDLVIEVRALPEYDVLPWVVSRMEVSQAKAARLTEILAAQRGFDVEKLRSELCELQDRVDRRSSDVGCTTLDSCREALELITSIGESAIERWVLALQEFLWLSECIGSFPASLNSLAASTRARLLETLGDVDREMSVDVRQAVLDRDDYICRYCGRRSQTMEVDHVIPVSQGGTSTLNNLVTACRECNRQKGGRTPDEAGMQVLPVRTRKRTGE